MTRVIPFVYTMASHLRWAVCCGCRFSICIHIATVHVWTSTDTYRFVLGSLFINKSRDSFCKHKLVLIFYPNCTSFTLLVACLCDPLIDGAFTVITLLHIAPCQIRHILLFFIGEEYIWISNVHTINYFVNSTSSSAAPATTNGFSSTTAYKSASTTSAAADYYSIHSIVTAKMAATDCLGVNPACPSS